VLGLAGDGGVGINGGGLSFDGDIAKGEDGKVNVCDEEEDWGDEGAAVVLMLVVLVGLLNPL